MPGQCHDHEGKSVGPDRQEAPAPEHPQALDRPLPGGRQAARAQLPTKDEARDFLIKYEHDNRLSIFTYPKAGPTFAETAATYIDRLDRAANTKRNYRNVLRKYIAPAMADRKLGEVAMDRDGVRDLIASVTPGMRHMAATVIIGTVKEPPRRGRSRVTGWTVSPSAGAR
jgi:hypothetical protein